MLDLRHDPWGLLGLDHFNSGRFFECHECWEELWRKARGESRELLQGIIQAAVALHHLQRGNRHGALTLWRRCQTRLHALLPGRLGVDLEQLLAEMNTVFAPLGEDQKSPLAAKMHRAFGAAAGCPFFPMPMVAPLHDADSPGDDEG